MTRKQLYFRLGIFILLAGGALVALVIVLGAGTLFRKQLVLESYFNESVQGLEVGSKVLFRGVVVGSALIDALKASLDKHGKATKKTVKAVTDLVASLADGVRGARKRSK